MTLDLKVESTFTTIIRFLIDLKNCSNIPSASKFLLKSYFINRNFLTGIISDDLEENSTYEIPVWKFLWAENRNFAEIPVLGKNQLLATGIFEEIPVEIPVVYQNSCWISKFLFETGIFWLNHKTSIHVHSRFQLLFCFLLILWRRRQPVK